MPNRTAKFVSAIIVSFMAGAPFAAMSQGATPATDNCLASPPKDAQKGGHWYYRIEHPSNRHCWYLRAEQAASSNASAPASAPAKSSPSPSPNAASAMPGSVANARAELTSPQTRSDPDASIATGQPPAAPTTGPVAGADNPAAVNVQDANTLRSVVASRWPDQLAANTSADLGTGDRQYRQFGRQRAIGRRRDTAATRRGRRPAHGCRGPAGKTIQLNPDADHRHRWRALGRRPRGKRGWIWWPAKKPSALDRRRSPRDLGDNV